MLGFPLLYFKGLRLMMFQLSSFYCKGPCTQLGTPIVCITLGPKVPFLGDYIGTTFRPKYMYVCMYVCMYTCMCICMYVYIYIYTYKHIHTYYLGTWTLRVNDPSWYQFPGQRNQQLRMMLFAGSSSLLRTVNIEGFLGEVDLKSVFCLGYRVSRFLRPA